MLSSSPAAALTGSFLWGAAGIILSPCHLVGIPLIVGYIDSGGAVRVSRAALISVFFSTGLLVTIAAIGTATAFAGRMLGDVGNYGNWIVAVLMVIAGSYLAGFLNLPFLDNGINQPGFRGKGLASAFILGLVFGLALGPCTFAFMAPVLGVAFTAGSTNLIFASGLVAAYAAGHCGVIIIAGSFTGFVYRILKWNEESYGALYLKKGCGILVIAAGIYMIVSLF